MTDLEHEEERPAPPPPDDDTDDAADLLNMVQDVNGKKVVGLDQLIEHRKANKAQKKEIADLKAKVESYAGIEERLGKVLPIAEAVEKDPRLAADIKAALDGTRRSQPVADVVNDDAEALEIAQTMNLITQDKDGKDVWDVGRAKRVLDISSARAEKRMKPQIDAATEASFSMRGEQNLAALYRMETPSGELVASDESIKEVLKESQMPVRMLADPRVARTVGLMAAGLDREKGRTPKAPIEPMYLERPTNRRSEPGGRISEADRRMAARVGLTDADLAAAGKFKTNRKGEVDLE